MGSYLDIKGKVLHVKLVESMSLRLRKLCLNPECTTTCRLTLLLLSLWPGSAENYRGQYRESNRTDSRYVPWRKSAVRLRILEWMKAFEALMW